MFQNPLLLYSTGKIYTYILYKAKLANHLRRFFASLVKKLQDPQLLALPHHFIQIFKAAPAPAQLNVKKNMVTIFLFD
jgi:hypothetical protein